MPTKITSLFVAGALLAFGLSAAPAQALGTNRTFVSGKGTDSGTCALSAPCRTFAFALTQTTAPGEIDVLDPAGYGAVTIASAINLINAGVGEAGIQVTSGNAITINAGPNDRVVLRGLTLNGLGTGTNGIQFATGAGVEILMCDIRNFTGAGINIAPSTSSIFTVSNTIASDNFIGIDVIPSGSAAVAGVLSTVTTNANNTGIVADGTHTTGSLTITLDNTETFANKFGIESAPGSGPATTVYLSRSTVTGNGTGVANNGGTFFTYGNNEINANTIADVSGTLTVVKTK